jgi:multidrug transporter EmrE-like cation transporter
MKASYKGRPYMPPKWVYFLLALGALAILGFVAANVAWLASLRSGAELSRGAILFSVLSSIGAVIIGVVVFQEKATPLKLLGLALGVVPVALLAADYVNRYLTGT